MEIRIKRRSANNVTLGRDVRSVWHDQGTRCSGLVLPAMFTFVRCL